MHTHSHLFHHGCFPVEHGLAGCPLDRNWDWHESFMSRYVSWHYLGQ